MARRPFLEHPGPIAFAHRGFSPKGLENTMAAFAAAVDMGFRWVETDVHGTADGVAVVLHDPTLDRVTDLRGRVAAMTWDQVRRARVGGVEAVPRLDDVLATWPDLRVNVDVKSGPAVGGTVAAIERTRAHDRVCVASFSDVRRRAVVRRLSRSVVTSAGAAVIATFLAAVRTGGPTAVRAALRGVDCLQVPEWFRHVRIVREETLAAAHAVGVPVHVWTVNDAADMHRLLDLGVDGLVTDRADLLRSVLEERGEWA